MTYSSPIIRSLNNAPFYIQKIVALTFLMIINQSTYATDFDDKKKLDVFINCSSCDNSFIRDEINYVNHVRDQAVADVFIFVTSSSTGSGGRLYELDYKGLKELVGINNKFEVSFSPTLTSDEIRKVLVEKIKLGLVSYLMHTDVSEDIKLSIISSGNENKQTKVIDPWNRWVFDVFGEVDIDKNDNRSELQIESGLEVVRVTENWRFVNNIRIDLRELTIQSDDGQIVNDRHRNFFSTLLVKSLGAHWSIGGFGRYQSSTFNNISDQYWGAPALEYSVFDYKEVLKREITFAYRIGYINQHYYETSIFNKDSDTYSNQALIVNIRYRQPWGRIFTSLQASHILGEFAQNRIELDNYITVRLFKGLSVRLSSEFDLIRDQLNLPAGTTSLEDLLLQQRQIATNYDLSFGLGLNYTFGSIYNNVINTRL
jgi:hypothetical protein